MGDFSALDLWQQAWWGPLFFAFIAFGYGFIVASCYLVKRGRVGLLAISAVSLLVTVGVIALSGVDQASLDPLRASHLQEIFSISGLWIAIAGLFVINAAIALLLRLAAPPQGFPGPRVSAHLGFALLAPWIAFSALDWGYHLSGTYDLTVEEWGILAFIVSVLLLNAAALRTHLVAQSSPQP
jgi:hypothetical protein